MGDCSKLPASQIDDIGHKLSRRRRNLLFETFVEYLEYFKPAYFLIENVIGFYESKQLDCRRIVKVLDTRDDLPCSSDDLGARQGRPCALLLSCPAARWGSRARMVTWLYGLVLQTTTAQDVFVRSVSWRSSWPMTTSAAARKSLTRWLAAVSPH